MKVFVYDSFPVRAKKIREAVFWEEQCIQNEFDEIDHTVTHIVLFNEDGLPVATCRVFWRWKIYHPAFPMPGAGFYQKLGYEEFGNIENEEGCPHIWMKKSL